MCRQNVLSVILAVLSYFFVSCGSRNNDNAKHVESYGYSWYEYHEDGLCGAKDEEGNILLPAIFKSISLDTFQIDEFNHALEPTKIQFWNWNAKDSHGEDLKISTWQYMKFKYSELYFNSDSIPHKHFNNPSFVHKKKLVNEHYETIYEGYFLAASCSYNNNDTWRFAGDMHKNCFFSISGNVYANDIYSLYINPDGEILIPASRRYVQIRPQCIDNYCFYCATIEEKLEVVLDNHGREIFRYNPEQLTSAKCHMPNSSMKEYYDADIASRQWITMHYDLTYDKDLGFGILENVPNYEGDMGDSDYWEWVEHIHHPKILWTNIKLPRGSESFYVSPSYDDMKAKFVNLQKIAKEY